MDDADTIEVARMIRPYLTELVGQERAAEIDRSIGTLLAGDPGSPEATDVLRALLDSEETLLQWAEDVLDDPDRLPPEFHERQVRGPDYNGLPGQGEPVPVDRFVCPKDQNYVWYRRSVGIPVPTCPDHGEILEKG